jgi:hypothetical protein
MLSFHSLLVRRIATSAVSIIVALSPTGSSADNLVLPEGFLELAQPDCEKLHQKLASKFSISDAEDILAYCTSVSSTSVRDAAMNLLVQQAENGNIDAAQFLAYIFTPENRSIVRSVDENYQQALHWWQRASDAGDQYGSFQAAHLLSDGSLEKNPERAATFILRFIALGGEWVDVFEGGTAIWRFKRVRAKWKKPSDPTMYINDFDRQTIRAVQSILRKNDYTSVKVDGIVGPATKTALKAWAASPPSKTNRPLVHIETLPDGKDMPPKVGDASTSREPPSNNQPNTVPGQIISERSELPKRLCFTSFISIDVPDFFDFSANIMTSNPQPKTVADTVKTIVRKAGLAPRYSVYKAPIGTACASRDSRGQPVIYYDDTWLKSYSNGSYWIQFGIIAHEIGHLANNHGPGDNLNQWQREYEADKFLGRQVALNGGTVDDAIVAVSLQPEDSNPTHPPRSARIAGVREGYFETTQP